MKNVSHRYRNKGFTLVELVVVMAILAIILGLSVVGILSWQDWADYKRQNEYAQTLFVAAQNQLTEYSENGQLRCLAEDMQDKNGLYQDYIKDLSAIIVDKADGTSGSLKTDGVDGVWKYATSAEDTTYLEQICYVTAEAGDYSLYTNGQKTKSATAPIVFRLVSSYVYDLSILDGAISIEFTPGEGQVFSACYSDKNQKFVYGEVDASANGVVNVLNRTEENRYDQMWGYYGVDTLAISTGEEQTRPKLVSVRLNNENTLNLSFKIGKVSNAEQNLNYDIVVYDADEIVAVDNPSNQKAISFSLDGSKLRNEENRSRISCDVKRYSYDAGGTETATNIGKYDILAWMDAERTIHVVLDAADLQASAKAYKQALEANIMTADNASAVNFAQTLSFHRFGVDADNVFCSIQAYGEDYKTTTVRETKVESAYFAKSDLKLQTKSVNYTYQYRNEITNARHLYNVRYAEYLKSNEQMKYSNKLNTSASGVTNNAYLLTGNVDWKAFVDSGSLYNTATTESFIAEENSKFPSIPQLRYGDEFSGEKQTVIGTNRQITNISISLEDNKTYQVYEDMAVTACKPVGLFAQNLGTIEHLQMDNVHIVGKERVGAFCGSNAGEITDLITCSTKQNSLVKGEMHVGGIVGYQAGAVDDSTLTGDSQIEVSLAELKNYATVEGTWYVGGIIGMVKVPEKKSGVSISVTVKNCNNYGPIQAVNSQKEDGTYNNPNSKTEARFLGGITGMMENLNTEDSSALKVINCNSSPEYSQENLDQILKGDVTNEEQTLADRLNGVYVGGIAGYNKNGTIANCSTEPQKGKNGYVFGYQYVGGIVGLNQGPASGVDEESNKQGYNKANVVGFQYVGGIVGCNANVQGDIVIAADIVEPDSTRDLTVITSNWVNAGIVYAYDSYAGGITGYNAGWLYNCNSEVKNDATKGFYQETYCGDYAGGIAGYNNGIIGNSKRNDAGELEKDADGKSVHGAQIKAVCYVVGKNYVGGVVGFNDVDAVVEDYKIAGGHICGNASDSMFVGGYAGLNASILLLQDEAGNAREIFSNPNEVTGQYFVGGSIGGNVINTHDYNKNENKIYAKFKTNNFLGVVRGDAFLSGFIGYNLFVESTETGCEMAIVTNLEEKVAATEDIQEMLQILADVNSDTNTDKKYSKSSKQLYIEGSDKAKTNTLGLIEGNLYLGGVLGYNDNETVLYIKDVVNTTPVKAKDAIEVAAEQDQQDRRTYNGQEFKYSYAGGIIGRVNKNVTLDNCKNAESGSVTSKGTYTGGLCEVNAGTIINCSVSNLGASAKDYVGGLCGLNKNTISECTFEGKTLYGRNYVGGIAAENFGTIEKIIIKNAKIVAAGVKVTDEKTQKTESWGVVGGITAYNGNGDTCKIYLAYDVDGITIESKGAGVGGAIGINAGNVYGRATADAKTQIKGKITGAAEVGGVIGINTGSLAISALDNHATVKATSENAGGIVGNNQSQATIEYCTNEGAVSVENSGKAGGITGENSGTIKECVNHGTIKAPNGNCAGIVALNNANAKVEKCTVNPAVEGTTLTFSSKKNVGGIVAENAGEITLCTIMDTKVKNYTSSGKSNVGVYVGINDKTGIVKLAAGSVATNCKATVYTEESNVGGIVGYNKGKISGAQNEEKYPASIVDGATAGLEANATAIANIGGVAGRNEGRISDIAVKTNLNGKLGSKNTGLGGIAGFSGYAKAEAKNVETKRDKASITNCDYSGELNGVGSADNILYEGGIAGMNGYDSIIDSCTIGKGGETKILADKTTSRVYLGGIAGNNYGEIVACDNAGSKETDTNKVTIVGQTGMIGGIVGFNHEGGLVTGRSNTKGTDKVIEKLTTGRNWSVTANSYSNDAGLGGIIGYSNSGQSMYYVENHANVSQTDSGTSANRSAGGFIGRLENYETAYMEIVDSKNYGDIVCTNRAGGFLATIKDKGISIINCANYGNIESTEHHAAGFIANAYAVGGDEICFDACTNFGAIKARDNAAGIMAFNENTSSNRYFSDCINVGVISGTVASTNVAGIATVSNGSFYECQNYGTFSGVYTKACGITTVDGRKLENCFDVSGNRKPLAKVSTSSKYNYYINKECKSSSSEANVTYFEEPPTSIQGHTGNVTDSLLDTLGEDTKRRNWQNLPMDLNVGVNLKNGDKMDRFVIIWCNNGTDETNYRTYTYDITFYDWSGNTIWEEKDRHANGYKQVTESIDSIQLPEELGDKRGEIKNIAITVKEAVPSENKNSKSPYVVIHAFNWIPVGSTERQICASSASTETLTYIETKVDQYYDGNGGIRVAEVSGKYNLVRTHVEQLENDPSNVNYVGDLQEYDGSEYRKPVYEELHTEIPKFMQEKYIVYKKLNTPTGVTMSAQQNAYRLSWNAVTGAYAYGVRYEVKDASGNIVDSLSEEMVKGRTFYEFLQKDSWDGCTIICYVRAIAANEILYGDNGKAFSSDEEKAEKLVTVTLPTPQAHLELIGREQVIAVLDNPEAYKEYTNCQIKVNLYNENLTYDSNGEITKAAKNAFVIDPAIGYTTEPQKIEGNFNTNTRMFIQAVPIEDDTDSEARYNPSLARVVETSIESNSAFLTGDNNTMGVNFKGFAGTTPEDLSYKLEFQKTNWDHYAAVDVMAFDDTVGTQISYAHTQNIHVTPTRAYAELTGFPRNLVKKDTILVRAYLWTSQSYAMQYGHEVGTAANTEELLQLVDGNSYKLSEDGSVCVREEQSIWKVLPEANPAYDPTNPDSKKWSKEGELQPGYVIYLENSQYHVLYSALQVCKGTDRSFEVKDISYQKGELKYTDSNNTSIKQYPAPMIDNSCIVEGNTYTFSWDKIDLNKNKDYASAEYSLELVGITANGEEISLATVDKVTMTELKESDWKYTFTDTNGNWKYPKLCLCVTRKGTANQNGYTTYLPDYSEKIVDLALQLPQMESPEVSLTKQENGLLNNDSTLHDVKWTGISSLQEAEYKALAGYLITVAPESSSSTDTTKYFYMKVPGKEAAVTLPEDTTDISDKFTYDASTGSAKAVVDFAGFTSGETVLVSVKAIAENKEKAAYISGPEGVPAAYMVEQRLETPDITVLEVKTGNSEEAKELKDIVGAQNIEFLQNGIYFIMPKDDETSSVKFQIAIAVTTTTAEGSATNQVVHTGDGAKDSEGYWNSGCVETLVSKSATDGLMRTDGTYTYQFAEGSSWADYAGMYLKIAIRSTSDNSISSDWSDEDGAGKDTVDYCYVKIPALKLVSNSISKVDEVTKLIYEDTDGKPTWRFFAEGDDEGEAVTFKTLRFAKQQYVTAYNITITKVSTDTTPTKINNVAVSTGLTKFADADKPDADEPDEKKLGYYIYQEDDNIYLVLPDNDSNNYTESITIQSINAKDTEQTHYVASDEVTWP